MITLEHVEIQSNIKFSAANNNEAIRDDHS